ncbi:MAG: hypothetical protein SNJ56_05555, partial [Termitinemataceae bacterium]
ATYEAMQGLEDRFSGWQLSVITNHPGFESFFGRRANQVRRITNGALPSCIYHYDCLGRTKHGHRR